jgi:hypothetical protein
MKRELYIESRIRRRENLPQQSLGKPERSRKKRNLQRSERRLPPASQEQRIRLPREPCCPPPLQKMDTDHKEKGSKQGEGSSSCSSGTSALKGEQKEACHYDGSILPRRPLHRGKSGIDPCLQR